MNHLPAGLSEPKRGREALPRGAHHREEERVGMEEEPTGVAPGLAVLYGFLFLCDSTAHSYRDWSRGARRGWPAEGSDTKQEGPKENRASGSLSPTTRLLIKPG